MFKFATSNNGKYCAMQEDNKIICKQDNEIKWTMEYPYKNLRLLFIGDNGTIVAIADDSVVKIHLDKYSSPEEIDCLSKKSLNELDSIVTNLNINANGSQLCFSTQNRTHNFAEGVQNFFTIPGAKKSLIKDRIHFYSLITGQKKDYYEHKSEYSEEYKFLWDISKDFFWIAIAEPDKKLGVRQTKISLINVQEFTSYKEETLKYNAIAKKILVNISGNIAVEVEDDKGKATILFKYQDPPVRLEMKMNQTLEHLGMDYVAFRGPEDEIAIKTFDNYVKCYAPFNSLNQMNIPWSLQYIEKNDMLLLMYDKGEFSINRTSFDSLSTDSTRWRLIKENFDQKENESREIVYAPTISRFNLHKQTRRPKIIASNNPLDPMGIDSNAPKKSVYAPIPIYKRPTSNRKLSLSLNTVSNVNTTTQNNENINYSSPESFFGDTNITNNEQLNNQQQNNYNPYAESQNQINTVDNGDFNYYSAITNEEQPQQHQKYDYESYVEPQNPAVPTPISLQKNNNGDFNYYSAITNQEQPPKQEYMHDMIRRISAEKGKAIRVIDIKPNIPVHNMQSPVQNNVIQSMPSNNSPLQMQPKNNVVPEISQEKAEAIKAEKKKIRQLITVLEERFIQGEISEETYKELKEKYTQKQKLIEDKFNV